MPTGSIWATLFIQGMWGNFQRSIRNENFNNFRLLMHISIITK